MAFDSTLDFDLTLVWIYFPFFSSMKGESLKIERKERFSFPIQMN